MGIGRRRWTFIPCSTKFVDLLRSRGRVSYEALKRLFGLDDAYLDDLKVELSDAQHLARDENGSILAWIGAAETPPSLLLPSTQHAPPNQEEVCPWRERVSEKALDVAYDHTRSTTAFLTLFMSITDWRMHGA